MIRDMKFAFRCAVLLWAGIGVGAATAQSTTAPDAKTSIQCPTPQPCKVVIITADEEQTLTGSNMIFELAEWAMRPLGPTIQAWRRKLDAAPAGVVKSPEKK